MINYPDGRKRVVEKKATTLDKRKTKNQTANERAYNSLVRSNMGMRFESEISKTCDFYRTKGIADIYKRPTPIKVVNILVGFRKLILKKSQRRTMSESIKANILISNAKRQSMILFPIIGSVLSSMSIFALLLLLVASDSSLSHSKPIRKSS